MAKACIRQPSKTVMQSGRGKTHHWELSYETERSKSVDPLTGWVGSQDTHEQVRIPFESLEAAEAFAQRQGLTYRIETTPAMRPRVKSYAEKLRSQRLGR